MRVSNELCVSSAMNRFLLLGSCPSSMDVFRNCHVVQISAFGLYLNIMFSLLILQYEYIYTKSSRTSSILNTSSL
jgi:hypothetical protein